MTGLPNKLRSWANSPIRDSLMDEAREYAVEAAAEIERFRSVLERIASTPAHHAGQTSNEYHFQEWAREALKKGGVDADRN